MAPSWANQLKSVRVWPSPDNTRVVLDMSSAPNFNYFTLTGPNRLVIDLKGASNATNLARIENKSELVRKIRESTPLEKGGLRLVLDLGSAIKPVVFPLAPAGPYGHRLVIDLPYEEKGAPRRSPRPSGAGQGHRHRHRSWPRRGRPGLHRPAPHLREAGDPGGVPEAGGPHRPRARHACRADPARRLLRRSEQALRDCPQGQGGSAGVGARRQLPQLDPARRLRLGAVDQPRQPRDGQLAGEAGEAGRAAGGVGKVLAESDPNPYLAQTFLDLSMDKSRAEGYDVSRQILRSLGRVARLHKKAPEHASLAVLKAPDIPSVLVETGFISNHAEEKLLATASYQDQLARAIFEGIRNYYRSHPTKGPMLTGKGQVAAPPRQAPASKPVAVSKPAAQPTQQVVTNRMPASEPYRVGEGGARSAVSAAPPVPA
jgi:N-acetylmuramoyl-L-alanine amidase